ncbi:MAG: radical SAM protein [Deltaproteobacteria bacterium]|nr:radical SAM protein [Deltaproteobacteria bacterium]
MTLRYYLPEEAPGFIGRLFLKPVPAFPETVLLETSSGCNGLCVFCPYEEVKDSLPKGRMEEKIFRKVVDEIARFRPQNLIPCFLNEPLLDPRLIERLQYIHEHAPATRINLTTNGSLLTEEKVAVLVDGGLLNEINISFQGISKKVYEASMPGLNFEKTRGNVEHLIRYVRKRGKKVPEITVTMVRTKIVAPEVEEALSYWKGLGVKARLLDYENRSGETDDTIATEELLPYDACKRPFNTAVVTFDGKVVLCCVDYKRKMIMGDLHEESLHSIWQGERFREVRKLFLSKRRNEIPACRNCRIAE